MGRTAKTHEHLTKIEQGFSEGKNGIQIANELGMTKQAIYGLIQHYLPHLKKQYRKNPQKPLVGIKVRTPLEREQRLRFSRKKENARQTGQVFALAFEDVVFPSVCPILGIPLDYFAEFRCENSASYDQIDPGKGYVPGNVRIISWRANRIKNDGTAAEHRQIADYLDNIAPKG